MELKPNFERLKIAINHQEADRVPFFEALIDYSIQSRFLGREVKPDDLKSQVQFWSSAGYDFIPITVGMMEPGEVTKESAISKIIDEIVLEDKDKSEDQDDKSWSLEYHSFIKNRTDFETFPWDVLAELNFDKFEEVKKEFGDKICLAGNVSNEMLQNAESADIEARVKELLRDIAPGGGYLLSAGNSVPAWAEFENYKAMIDTGLKYGRYPIQI